MQEVIIEFIEIFKKVKSTGFIETHRTGNTGIGKTFEDVCGIIENNNAKSDFKGIELKSQRDFTKSAITLFTLKPTYPEKFKERMSPFCVSDAEYFDIKILHTTINTNRFNTHQGVFGFKLEKGDKKGKSHDHGCAFRIKKQISLIN